MNKTLAIVLAVVVSLVILPVVVGFTSYVSYGNRGNEYESALNNIQRNNENILAQYGQKIQEAAQVPTMQTDALKELFSESNKARYGVDGSKAMFQMLKEQNPNLDQKTFVQLQRMIEAGRDQFQVNQTKLLDIRRSYERDLGYFWSGFWMKLAGYPKGELSRFDIVSTDRASEAFRTKKEKEPLKLK